MSTVSPEADFVVLDSNARYWTGSGWEMVKLLAMGMNGAGMSRIGGLFGLLLRT